MKLFISLLKTRLEDQIEIRNEQQGLKRNISTIDAAFIIQQIKEKAIGICFIDLTKTFDRVRLKDEYIQITINISLYYIIFLSTVYEVI